MNQQSVNTTDSNSSSKLIDSVTVRPNKILNSTKGFNEQTPLSIFVKERMNELGLKQSDFCRRYAFDQGMLSRIQNSVVVNLNLESVLRLAIGLQASPLKILELIGRIDLHDLIWAAYTNELLDYLQTNKERRI